jgi:hypothetical protein
MTARPLPTDEPLDDELRELMDTDTWDWENASEGRTIGKPGAIVRVRFSREEFRALAELAHREGMGPAELIHTTMMRQVATTAV